MTNYELTERGKIFIAVVLVIVLLVIPSAIILGAASCSGSSPPENGSSSSEPPQPPGDDDPPAISNSPLPPGSGFDPSDPEEPTSSPEPSPTPSGGNGDGDNLIIDDTPVYGPVGLDLTRGTMSFIFSPSEQNTLDEDTVDMLGDFLSSPKNTSNAQIMVELPQVSDADEAALIAAVEKAFSLYNIGEDELVYVKSETAVLEQYFEVALSFAPISNRK